MEEYLFRYGSHGNMDIVDSEGSYLIGKNGKKYLDFVMGWCVGNVGWNKKAIMGAVRSFKGPTYVSPYYKYDKWDILAKKLVDLMPDKNYTCFRATGGTEAVELALKIAKAYNHREKFIAFKSAYHGQSFACMSLVAIHEHENNFGPFPDSYIHLEAENWEKTTEKAVNTIKKGDVCAFISEPIICNLGVIMPPKSFFEEVYKTCKETDTVFIADEVASGFGRTGKWFAFEHYNLKPDIVTIAKGFSSGYGAIGAAIATKEVAESMRFDFSNYSSFGWLPIETETAIANIGYMEKNNLVKKSEESGKYLMKKLSEFCEPEGRGLCVGFNTKNENIREECLNDGLIISTTAVRNSRIYKNRVMLFPALDVSKKEIDEAVNIIKKHF